MNDEQKPPRQWPQGRLSGDDDGSCDVMIGIAKDGKTIIMQFGGPIKWFGFGPEIAVQMAGRLMEHAITANKNAGGPPLILDVNGVKLTFTAK